MAKTYTVLMFFELEAPFFYLFINFVDLMFNNFSVPPIEIDHNMRGLEILLLLSINLFNVFLLFFGILAFFTFLFLKTYKTVFHSMYIWTRLIITIFRTVFYVLSFLFYIYLTNENPDVEFNVFFKLVFLGVLIFLEINDVYWGFLLRRIVNTKSDDKEKSDKSTIRMSEKKAERKEKKEKKKKKGKKEKASQIRISRMGNSRVRRKRQKEKMKQSQLEVLKESVMESDSYD